MIEGLGYAKGLRRGRRYLAVHLGFDVGSSCLDGVFHIENVSITVHH